MNELLWLLLPVAAASGWFMAARSAARGPQRGGELSSEYFKGLNFLLNEQPDEAIDVFIRMLEVDSDTVETHLALGNLFRRRGEVDRAIRIHQNLIARPTLSKEQRSEALLELGQDYMRAGLFDRAESLFQELVENNTRMGPALQQLLAIYQQEKDWEQAVATARQLSAATGRPMHGTIAQFYCELAEDARRSHDTGRAQQMVKRALAHDKHCVRASIIQGDMAREAGDLRGAIRCYRRVEEQDIEFLPEVIAPLRRCYEDQGNLDAMIEYLQRVLDRYDGVSPMLALAELLLRRDGETAAAVFVAGQLKRRPSVRGLERLIDLNLSHSEGSARDNLLILRELVGQLLERKPVYKCLHCGFTGKVLHWQCPSCKKWNATKPIHGVEGE